MRFTSLVLLLTPVFTLSAGDMIVTSFQQLTADGGRVAWSPQNVIAFDRPNASGTYDVWTMNPDASNQVCLTCNFQIGSNKGNPDWHPSGKYIVFEVGPAGQDSTPGVGIGNVLWVMDADGQNPFQILPASAFQKGVLHPHFSHDGKTLIWAQAVDPFFGNWEIQVASFTAGSPPVVTLVNTLTPGPCHNFYETHGFSLDDQTIFFSGNPTCQKQSGTDIYSSDLQGNHFVDLTNTPNDWDEHSRPSPTQEKLIWVSSVGTATTSKTLLLEYWTMNYDGTDKKKMTWFTDARAAVCHATTCTNPASFPAAATVGDNDWSPDGTQSVIYVINPDSSGGSTLGSTGSIWLMTLAPSSTTASSASYVNYPQAPDSIAASFGLDLATSTVAAAATPIPDSLAGTTVNLMDAVGATRPAQLFFASASQVNWYVPAGTAPGPATVTTTSGDGTVTTDIFDVENAAPAVYSVTGSGSGPAAGYVVTATQPYVPAYVCTAECTTSPIDVSSGTAVLVLFGTGVRHYQNGPVMASVGSPSIAAVFAGAQPNFTGLDQINIPLPAALAGSGPINVFLTVDGLVSNSVQIQIK